jgi:hypothetical protein
MNRRIPNGTYGGVGIAPCKFKEHVQPEMVVGTKLSQQSCTESCVVRGNTYGEA